MRGVSLNRRRRQDRSVRTITADEANIRQLSYLGVVLRDFPRAHFFSGLFFIYFFMIFLTTHSRRHVLFLYNIEEEPKYFFHVCPLSVPGE